jgi:hypothetical protein
MQMNEQHVFSCMDSSFMHTLPEKIEHVRRLRAVDFQEDQEDHEGAGLRDEHPHPQQEAPPALLLEDVPRDPSPGVDIDAMDVDREESEGEYEEPEDDDEDKEAPSEQDTDEAASRGESGHMDTQSDEGESIHTQSPAPEYAASPMRGRVLEFEGHEHVTSLAEGEAAEDAFRDEDHEGDAEDSDHEEEVEGTLEGELEGSSRGALTTHKKGIARKHKKNGRRLKGKIRRILLKTKPNVMRPSSHPNWQPPPGPRRRRLYPRATKNFHRPVPQSPRPPSEASTKTGIRNDIVLGFQSL